MAKSSGRKGGRRTRKRDPFPHRRSGPSFTIEELEEELICWACSVYKYPEFGPIMDIVERILIEARNHHASAKRIIDGECEKMGCPPVNSLSDLAKFLEMRKKSGVRMRPRARAQWRGSFSERFKAEMSKL